MPGSNGFPKHLLEQSIEERVRYFKNFTVNHPKFKKAFDELLDLTYSPDSSSIILVYGPTGVGKSTLFQKVYERLFRDAMPSLKSDPGKIPVVGMEAIAPDNSNFDWKDFYIRALEAIDEPLIDFKVDFQKMYETKSSIKYTDVNRKLRKALENALKNRNSTAFMIDEGQHLTKMTSGRKLRNQMDLVKSLASLSKVPYIMFGTYELLSFCNLSGQLTRRESEVHFERYYAENEGDMKVFKNVLYTFQKHLPLKTEPDLISHYDFFYERSIGCVGILKTWLEKTYSRSLDKGATTMTIKDFEKYAHTATQCLKMAAEAREGEKDLGAKDERDDLRMELGMGRISENNKDKKQKNTSRRVGERKAKRDKVGMENVR